MYAREQHDERHAGKDQQVERQDVEIGRHVAQREEAEQRAPRIAKKSEIPR